MAISIKKCSKCKETKGIGNFRKIKLNKDGYCGQCTQCRDIIAKAYTNNNKEIINARIKIYKKNNKEKIKNKNKEYRENNKDKAKKYYEDHKLELKIYKKEYAEKHRIKNRPILNKKRREYLKNNQNAKITASLRRRFYSAIKVNNNKKHKSTIEILGCSIDFFKEYIEIKFTEGMTWENYGKSGWHFDHIRPCTSFDLSDPEQQKQCFHYTNYQPLWATTKIAISYGESFKYIGNLDKSDKYYCVEKINGT